ncbi:DUF2793 domain-containing protein [Jiella avicenniae]|uniref:DUF2793 domain-containing protein n=1 Tax=Jiella avicenniae TaxID=2907202 RepID=A0A9X1T415_9HYPH|nr:DUF2793 domain-containing protein [Jiella avicenniae]MCE7028181.1 DUF2793 domain-containing protein [Jiella avicenniae]
MADTTDRLALPYILADQAQKHVTHNDGLVRLDALVHLAVLDRDRTEPPAAPSAGDRHIVAAEASGEWAGRGGTVAVWQDGVWMFLEPQAGWRAWCIADEALLVHDGDGWAPAMLGPTDFAGGALSRLGVNTAADDFNRVAIKTSALLVSHDDASGSGNGSVLGTFNKEDAGKDAGFNFQSGWSTRALMGLYGDEDFRIKVSPDGAAFHDALAIDRTTGRVSFPKTGSIGAIASGLFHKADAGSVAFARTGSGTLELKAGSYVEVAGFVHGFAAPTSVQMPALAAGTDYAVYVCSDGTVRADAGLVAPAGFTAADSRKIGGFHYAAGGNAPGYNAGGDTTPQINPYSLWDLKWRPACADPRGMALVAGRFWCDVYLTGVDAGLYGSSRSGVAVATGAAPPKIPVAFGGDGTATYGSFTWYEAVELLASVGKGLLDYDDYVVAAFGTTEAATRGNNPFTTGLGTTNAGSTNSDQKFTSIWGIIQSSGCYYTWGKGFGGSYTTGWSENSEGRGQMVSQPSALLLGANYADGARGGSRTAAWNNPPWTSVGFFASRGRCEHLAHL